MIRHGSGAQLLRVNLAEPRRLTTYRSIFNGWAMVLSKQSDRVAIAALRALVWAPTIAS